MTSSTTASPAVIKSKPQVKLLSSACRNLFGRSEAVAVTQLLNEMIVADRKRAGISFNFDIQKEKPIQGQQSENVAEMDKTPDQRRRYQWKQVLDRDIPEFYSRRYKGKKSLMPVELLADNDGENVSSSQNGRSRTARRSLNGYLRSSPRPLSPKTTNVIRPASTSKLSLSSLRLSSHGDSPVAFDDSYKARVPAIPRPLPVHAPSENVTTAKTVHHFKPISPQVSRSPSTYRKNINSPRYLDSPDRIRGSPASKSQSHDLITTPAKIEPVPVTPSQSSPKTPAQPVPVMPVFGAERSLKQQKITDQFKTAKKQRVVVSKSRKRLTLSQDDSAINLASKIPKLSSSNN